jgi:pimeloyl-ACP methyl ester carboxylesterase
MSTYTHHLPMRIGTHGKAATPAHLPGGDLAILYAARHPQRIRTLTLVTARARALGVDFTEEHRREAAAQAHTTSDMVQSNAEAADMYASSAAFDPAATRAAISALDAPVLVLAGEVDGGPLPRVAIAIAIAIAIAAMFLKAKSAVQPDAGHIPWLDDPRRFT